MSYIIKMNFLRAQKSKTIFQSLWRGMSTTKSFYDYPVLEEKLNLDEEKLQENLTNMNKANETLLKNLERVRTINPKEL